MQIKYRITFIYTLLVMVLMVLLCVSTYFALAVNREQQIKKRLRNRAINTAYRFFDVQEIDTTLMRRMDKAAAFSAGRRYLVIYNEQSGIEYMFRDELADTVWVTPELRAAANQEEGFYFRTPDKRDVLAMYRQSGKKKYLMISAVYDAEGFALLSNLRFIFLVSLVAGAVITFITGYIFSTRIVSPINKMAIELNSITSGRFDKKLDTHEGKNELERLATAINDLLDRLKNSFDTQSRFISNASHELRTPLASISNAVQVALHQDRDSEAYKKVLVSVNEDVMYLNQMVTALLELAMASGTQQGLTLEEVRTDELLMEMPVLMRKVNREHNIILNMDKLPEDGDALLVYGNRDLLMTAFRNIIGNACKFGDENQADVTLAVNDGKVIITIENEGPAIPEEEFESIFMPFYRGKRTGSVTPGAGLGLSLANRIIGLHNGSISVSSKGGYTVFKIILPAITRTYLQQHNIPQKA